MGISERQNEILKIIGKNTYVSVNELSERTFTSPSSIRRDLTKLQNMYKEVEGEIPFEIEVRSNILLLPTYNNT